MINSEGKSIPSWFKFSADWRGLISVSAPEHVVAALLAILDYMALGEILPDNILVCDERTGKVAEAETKLLILAFKPAVDTAIRNTRTWRRNGGGNNPDNKSDTG